MSFGWYNRLWLKGFRKEKRKKYIMGNSPSKNDSIHEKIGAVYSYFRTGAFKDAIEVLNDALSLDFEHKDVIYALKSASFWKERVLKLQSMTGPFETGEYLTREWKVFIHFLGNQMNHLNRGSMPLNNGCSAGRFFATAVFLTNPESRMQK